MGFWGKQKSEFMDALSNTKNEQKAISDGTAGRFDYLGGHPNLVAGEIIVWKGKEPNTLTIQQNTGNKFTYDITVTKLEWDEKGKRSAGKAVAGAVIGGVLTGGVGLLVGGAIGGRKKDNSLAVMTYRNGVVENTIYFRADNNEYQKLAQLLS